MTTQTLGNIDTLKASDKTILAQIGRCRHFSVAVMSEVGKVLGNVSQILLLHGDSLEPKVDAEGKAIGFEVKKFIGEGRTTMMEVGKYLQETAEHQARYLGEGKCGEMVATMRAEVSKIISKMKAAEKHA